MTDSLEGGCACGAVRYRMGGPPIFVHCCHCTRCQIETGSAFALNVIIEASRVALLTGAPEAVMTPSESGRGQQFWRCPTCRVAVWSNYGDTRDRIRFVRVGTLDKPDAITPDIHIYTRSKLPWVTIPEGALTAEAFYDVPATWPAESLARWRAATA